MSSLYIRGDAESGCFVVKCANCGKEFFLPKKKVKKKTGKIEKYINSKNYCCSEKCERNLEK